METIWLISSESGICYAHKTFEGAMKQFKEIAEKCQEEIRTDHPSYPFYFGNEEMWFLEELELQE